MGLHSKHHHHHGGIHLKRLERKASHLFNKKVAPTITATTAITKPLAKGTLALGQGVAAFGTITGQPELVVAGGALMAGGAVGVGISTALNQTVKASAKTEKGEDASKNIQKAKETGDNLYKEAPSKDDVFSLFI